jgi:hypothetical protein
LTISKEQLVQARQFLQVVVPAVPIMARQELAAQLAESVAMLVYRGLAAQAAISYFLITRQLSRPLPDCLQQVVLAARITAQAVPVDQQAEPVAQ